LAVLSQEGVHGTRLHKVLAEDGGVEELAIRFGRSLHPPILLDLRRNREFCRIAQRSPRDESSLFEIANNYALRHRNDSQRDEYAEEFLEWVFWLFAATIELTDQLLRRSGEAAP
jgi:hypothetical protein